MQEATVYKVIKDFGSLQLDPLLIVLIVASLLLLALAQSYASARKLRMGPAVLLSLAMLVIGNAIVYFAFDAFFREKYHADYVFEHVAIYSYGFMLMIAFVVGTIWLIRQGRKEDPPVEVDTILDLMVFIIIGSIIGARAIYVLTQAQHYQGVDAPRMLQITEGGLSIHGGIMGAMLAGWAYTAAKKLDFWKITDLIIMAVPLGMFFGRIGCFLNGCCFGYQCADDWPLRFHFPNAADWQEKGMNPELARLYDSGHASFKFWRHPAQLYEAVGALVIFFYLINFRNNKVFKGHMFLMFVWLYSVLRFIVEFYRFGDPDTGRGSSVVLWNSITVAQVASIVLGFVALLLMNDLKRRAQLAKLLADDGETPAESTAAEEEESDEEEEYEEEEEVEVEETDRADTGEVEGEAVEDSTEPPEEPEDDLRNLSD